MLTPYLPSRSVAHQLADGRFIVVNPFTRRWVIADEAGLAVLRLFDGHSPIESIFPDDGSFGDLSALVAQLIESGILQGAKDETVKEEAAPCSCGAPRSLHLEITNRCNLACRHCYASSGKRQPNELTFSEIAQVIDQFASLSCEGDRGPIAITGGEARLRPDCLKILSHARARGLETLLFTDAVGFPEQFAREILDLGVNVQISLDGPDAQSNDFIRGRGSFYRICKGIATMLACGLGPRMTIFVTLTKGTIGRIEEMVVLAENCGVNRIHFSQLNRQGRATAVWGSISPTTEDWIRAGQIYRTLGERNVLITHNLFGGLDVTNGLFPAMRCAIPSSPRVDCQGHVYPCQLFVSETYRVGNIREQSLGEILSSERVKEIAAAAGRRPDDIPGCRVCNWKSLCYSGCPGLAVSESASMGHEDSYCEVRKFWFAHSASDFNVMSGGTNYS